MIEVVDHITGDANFSTTLEVENPSTAADQLVRVTFRCIDGGTMTAPDGTWTLEAQVVTEAVTLWVWTHVTGGSEPATYDFAISASFINLWNAVAYSGVDTASPTYGTTTNSGADGAYTSAGATVLDDDSRVVISATCNSGDGGMTAPSGMALEVDTEQLIVAGGEFDSGATGALSGTNGVSEWMTATAVLRPTGTGGGGGGSYPLLSAGARQMRINGIYRR